jgi:hypothetical protein
MCTIAFDIVEELVVCGVMPLPRCDGSFFVLFQQTSSSFLRLFALSVLVKVSS